jgi:hypothetical protein
MHASQAQKEKHPGKGDRITDGRECKWILNQQSSKHENTLECAGYTREEHFYQNRPFYQKASNGRRTTILPSQLNIVALSITEVWDSSPRGYLQRHRGNTQAST